MSDATESRSDSPATARTRNPRSAPADVPPPVTPARGGDIVAELEVRFEQLRQWHDQCREQFRQQQAELDARADEVARTREEADTTLREVQAQREAARQAREKLENDRAAFETYCKGEEAALGKQRLACEEWVAAQHAAAEAAIAQRQARATDEVEALRAKADAALKDEYDKLAGAKRDLKDALSELEHQREKLAQTRVELDAEWDSVRMVRAAEDAALRAWQHEKDRVQKMQLRLVPAERDTPEQPPRAQAA